MYIDRWYSRDSLCVTTGESAWHTQCDDTIDDFYAITVN